MKVLVPFLYNIWYGFFFNWSAITCLNFEYTGRASSPFVQDLNPVQFMQL